MRRRLTRDGLFRRIAAPDEFSGRNMNTPIILYDIKPNQRFPVGSVVTFIDDTFLRLRGTVLGHAAEDRLWVQWPTEIRQMDTDEVVSNDETQDGGTSSPVGVVSSRGSRQATTLAFDNSDHFKEGEGEDLEFIPDQADFSDGDPVVRDGYTVNEIHTGELPSEQDPRDKVEEGSDHDQGCNTFELVFTLPESGDMTDFLETGIMASRKGALYTGEQNKNPILNSLLQMKDENGEYLYKNESDAALNYNVFDDKNVQSYLWLHGLNEKEIKNFADIRQHQLEQAKQRVYLGNETSPYGVQKTPNYSWGQGTQINYNVKKQHINQGDKQTTKIKMRHHPNVKTPQDRKYVQETLIPALQQGKTLPGVNPEITKWYYDQLKQGKTRGKQPERVTQQAQKPVGSGTWPKEYPPGGANKWHGWRATSNRSLGKLTYHADLVDRLLKMPRTAKVLRQTADLVSAVCELDNGKSLDEKTRSALRNTSRNLLTATDHLKGVNNRVANRVAGKIEQLYVDSLSN
jgi:hypothetical protein